MKALLVKRFTLGCILMLFLTGFSFAGEKEDQLFAAVEKGDLKEVKALIKKGADVNAKVESGQFKGRTPLHFASNEEIAKILIAKGADVKAKDIEGRTPLHYASRYGHTELAKILIAKGADVKAKDDYGWTPLHFALKNDHKELAKILIAKGARR